MSFNSISFFLFFAGFLALWPICRRQANLRWSLICVASFVFYGWWDWRFAILLFATGAMDFFLSRAIYQKPEYRRLWLGLSFASNLGILGFFKYSALFRRSLADMKWIEAADWRIIDDVVLPVGISFYTFQALSYTIDVYRGHIKPAGNLLHFWAYLSFFPQLVAGPIVRAKDFIHQLEGPGAPSKEARWSGLELITLGYFKKVVVADNLAPIVSASYADVSSHPGGLFWWIVNIFFAIQIYCDFSGYSDIARGISRWLGYELPLNFNRPYQAIGLREFWGKWHTSLSTWFRDYVYIPLGGGRESAIRTGFNLLVTMLLSGLWHGANWTFVLWGAVHAVYLFIERATNWPRWFSIGTARRLGGKLLTFGAVVLAWAFFRAETVTDALKISSWMIADPMGDWLCAIGSVPSSAWLALLAYSCIAGGAKLRIKDSAPSLCRYAAVVCGLTAAVFLRGPGSTFIYFQF